MNDKFEISAGFILLPEQTAMVASQLPNINGLEGYSIAVSVQPWVIASLSEPSPQTVRFAMVTPDDGSEPLLMLVAQNGDAQIRLVIRSASIAVQALLTDSIEKGRIKIVLRVNGAQADHVLTIGPRELRSVWLKDVLRDSVLAKSNEANAWAALDTMSQSQQVPSLLPGYAVKKAVTALIARVLPIKVDLASAQPN